MKHITIKLTTNESLLVSETTENQIKMQMSKIGSFSPIPIFFQ